MSSGCSPMMRFRYGDALLAVAVRHPMLSVFLDVFSRFLFTDKTKPEFGDLPLALAVRHPFLSKNNEFSFSH